MTLAALDLPQSWANNIDTALGLIDDLDSEIKSIERELRTLGADHPYVSLLQSVPGVAWILGYTIASEIGDISRFPSQPPISRPERLPGRNSGCHR